MLFGKHIQLFSINEVPLHQQSNRFILHGYRAYLSAKDCVRSITIWSNELLNVWSHVVTFILFFYLMLKDHLCNLPAYNTPLMDHIVFLVFNLCCQACMVFSAAYHTFNCHRHYKVVQNWLSADLAGITAAMLGCYCIGLYYGFYCHQQLRGLYMALCSLVIVVSMAMMFHPKYSTDDWWQIRTGHLTFLCLMGVAPIVNFVYKSPSFEIALMLPSIIKFYLILGAAMFFYISKFPERILPGKFDYIGQSHTLWHTLISASLLYWRSFALDMAQYRNFDECECKSCPAPNPLEL